MASDAERVAVRTECVRREPCESPPDYLPVVVADRPNHLRIIQRALRDTDRRLGIMTHPYINESVEELFHDWPADLREQTVLISDNGAFKSEGRLSTSELFDWYDELDVDYGLVPDEIGDPHRTDELAWTFANRYMEGDYDWLPVAVAHGDSPAEYRQAYHRHRTLGYDHGALGGLLEMAGDRSGGHANGRSDLWDVVHEVAAFSPNGWVFALGAGHRERHPRFDSLDLAGADGKGWLFRYSSSKRREEELAAYLRETLLSGQVQPSLADAVAVPQ